MYSIMNWELMIVHEEGFTNLSPMEIEIYSFRSILQI